MLKFLCITLSIFALVTASDAKFIQGHILTSSNWAFVTRFVFVDEEAGRLEYNVEYPINTCCPSLVFYYADDWSEVYPHTDKNCSYKMKFAEKVYDFESKDRHCTTYNTDGVLVRHCSGQITFHAIPSRWWFLVFSQCSNDKHSALDMTYTITVANGDSWERHLSAEEFHVLEVTAVFLCLYTCALVVGIVFAAQLAAAKLLHRPYRVFLLSLVYEEGALMFETARYVEYVQDGLERMSLQTAGYLLHALSDTMFIVLLLLVAKGYTITRGRLHSMTKLKLAVFTATYGAAHIASIVIKTEFLDQGIVSHPHEDLAGLAVLSVRVAGWLWFVYAVLRTVCKYPEKGVFYSWFCVVYSVWFLAEPVLMIFSHFYISDWQRAKAISTAHLTTSAAGYFMFLHLTRPTHANTNFPFHVRTTQIDVIADTDSPDLPHTEAFSKVSKKYEGVLETSLTELENADDNKDIDGIVSSWFPGKH